MYIPKHFQIKDSEEIEAFLRANAFGILVSCNVETPTATHIPLELHKNEQGDWLLRGHLARANPHAKILETQPHALAIFQAAHHYVSSSWYSTPNVSTWNYQAVHVYGNLRIVSNDELLQSLQDLTSKYENGMEKPVLVENLPQAMIQTYMRALVGFEIAVTDVQAKYKLSQNRMEGDQESIVNHLREIENPNEHAVAYEMKRILEK